MTRHKNTAEDFWKNVNKPTYKSGKKAGQVRHNQCWPWKGTNQSNGYAQITINGKRYLVHRFAFMLEKGDPFDGVCITHTCDNRLCCNTKHLKPATAKENSEDMSRKGRARNGASVHGRRALPQETKELIFQAVVINGSTWNDAAASFGVSRFSVYKILKEKGYAYNRLNRQYAQLQGAGSPALGNPQE